MGKTLSTTEKKRNSCNVIELPADCGASTGHLSREPTRNPKEWSLFRYFMLACRQFLKMLRFLFTPAFRFQNWQGLECNSGQIIRVAYIGDDENRLYWQDLIYGNAVDVIQDCTLYWWQLKKILRETKSKNDISVVDIQYPFTMWFQDGGMLQIPRWVKQRVAIAPCWEKVLEGMRRKTRKEAQRLIRKYGFRTRISSGDEKAAFFYDKIYRPFILKRYGTTAFLVRRQDFLRECRSGQILELISGDEVIAASMIRQTNRQLAIVWTGIMLDIEGVEHPGASDALDYFSLHYAHQRGCEFLDFGPSRPRLNDGLLNYKKKWGASLYTGKVPQGLFVVIPQQFSVPVQAMLESAQFITLEKGCLVGNLFVPRGKGLENIEASVDQHWADGLDSLRFHMFHSQAEKLQRDNFRVEILSLSDSHTSSECFSRAGSP